MFFFLIANKKNLSPLVSRSSKMSWLLLPFPSHSQLPFPPNLSCYSFLSILKLLSCSGIGLESDCLLKSNPSFSVFRSWCQMFFRFFFPLPFLPYRLVARRTRNHIGEGWLRGLDANAEDLSLIFTAMDFLDHLWQVSEAKDPQQKMYVSIEL